MTAPPHTTAGPAPDAGPTDTATLIERLSGFRGPAEQFLQELVAVQCHVGRASGGAILKLVADQPPQVLATYPAGMVQENAPPWLARAFEIAKRTAAGKEEIDAGRILSLQHSTAATEGGGPHTTHLVLLPIRGDPPQREIRGVMAFHLGLADLRLADLARRQLELTAPLLTLFELRLSLQKHERDMQVFAAAMQTLDAVNQATRFKTAAMALCNEAATTWHAARVSVGFVAGRYVKLRAMSQTEDVSPKMQLVQDIESVMEEALDQDAEVLHPQPAESTAINRLARKLAEKHGPSVVCSLPLRHEKHPVGVMTVEFPADRALTADEVEALRITANLCTARLYQLSLTDRWLGARCVASARRGAGLAVGPKHTWAKLTALAGVAVLAFLLFAKGPDRVEAPFTIQTSQRHIVTAPFDGTVDAVNVEVSDPVRAGETVLASLAMDELVLERAPLVAEQHDYAVRADAARDEGDFAGMEMALANADRVAAQIRLLDHRIAQAEMTSPIDGVIIEGDLLQRAGGTVEKGEPLFQVASIDALRAELRVPASRISEIRSAATHPDNPSRGELASTAHPGEHVGFTVVMIEPEAEVVAGRNIFRVRVSLDTRPPWMQPGVEGVAKIHVGTRRYATLWTREAVNWIRMKLWL